MAVAIGGMGGIRAGVGIVIGADPGAVFGIPASTLAAGTIIAGMTVEAVRRCVNRVRAHADERPLNSDAYIATLFANGHMTPANCDVLFASGRMTPENFIELVATLFINGRMTPANHDMLLANGRMTEESVSMLIHRLAPVLVARGASAHEIAWELRLLIDDNLLTQDNFNALIESGANAQEVAWGFRLLNEVQPTLLTAANRAALVESGANAQAVARGLRILNEAQPTLLTSVNRVVLVASGVRAPAVALGLRVLSEAQPSLLTPANRMALVAMIGANEVNAFIPDRLVGLTLTQEIFDTLVASGARAELVSRGFSILSWSRIWTPTNCAALVTMIIASGANAENILNGLSRLWQRNFLTQPNFDALVASGRDAERVAAAIEYHCLNAVNGRMTQAEFDEFIAHTANDPLALAEGINILRSWDLLTPTNRAALISSGRNIEAVADAFRRLSEYRYHCVPHSFLTENNVNCLFDQVDESGHTEPILGVGDRLPFPLSQETFDEFLQNLYAQKYRPDGAAVRARAVQICRDELSGRRSRL